MRGKTLVFTAAAVALFALAAFGIARAQQTAPAAPTAPSATCQCMQPGMMGQGPMMRMGLGNMGMAGGMGMQARTMRVRTGMMGSCPLMVSGANVEVKSIANGAVITITSADAKTAKRIQIMAEMMKLRQELRSLQ